jgi:DNA-binding transcriptional regulator YhcF (GntR family)
VKFWLSKNSEVSIHEQIVTQIRLGVASRDLLPGEKLPSTRELARRFGIHANTVSAAYRELAAEGLVDFRKGSGVFVTEAGGEEASANSIDVLLANFVGDASSAGFTRPEIESAMTRWLDGKGKRKLVLVESDPGLRSILEEEIAAHLGILPKAVTHEEFVANRYDGATIVALFDEKEKIQPLLGPEQKAVFIDANSVPHSLMGNKRPDAENLIAVVSCWSQFVAFARIYLLAAKIDPEALIIRSTDDADWASGLNAASIVICDSFTARHFGNDPRLRVFRLITDASTERLKHALV